MDVNDFNAFFSGGSFSGNDSQFELSKEQLRIELILLNQAILKKDKSSAITYAQIIVDGFGELRPLAVSGEVCDSVVGVLKKIAAALAGTTVMEELVQLVLAVENWQKTNKVKVILDFEALKSLAFS